MAYTSTDFGRRDTTRTASVTPFSVCNPGVENELRTRDEARSRLDILSALLRAILSPDDDEREAWQARQDTPGVATVEAAHGA